MHGDICFEQKAIDSSKIRNIGDLAEASYIGWMISGVATVIASFISLYLVFKHAQYYTKKNQQRHIIRIILIIPIYSVTSWLSYFYYRNGVYYELFRDMYEAFVIASFFILMLQYLGDSAASQRDVMNRHRERMPLAFPFCCITYKPSGRHFMAWVKWGIMQYVVLRPIMTVASVILHYFGHYCPESMSWKHSHTYFVIVTFVSVTIALYALIALYQTVKEELAPYEPLSKFLSIKLIIFVTFWQYVVIAVAAQRGYIKETQYWTIGNILTGLNSILICFEMIVFAVAFSVAFDYRPYRPETRQHTPRIWKAFVDSLNPMDFLREIWYLFKYCGYLCGARKLPTHYLDKKQRKLADFEKVMEQTWGPDDDDKTVVNAPGVIPEMQVADGLSKPGAAPALRYYTSASGLPSSPMAPQPYSREAKYVAESTPLSPVQEYAIDPGWLHRNLDDEPIQVVVDKGAEDDAFAHEIRKAMNVPSQQPWQRDESQGSVSPDRIASPERSVDSGNSTPQHTVDEHDGDEERMDAAPLNTFEQRIVPDRSVSPWPDAVHTDPVLVQMYASPVVDYYAVQGRSSSKPKPVGRRRQSLSASPSVHVDVVESLAGRIDDARELPRDFSLVLSNLADYGGTVSARENKGAK